MEKLLHKLARQLDSLDEASLMSLWSKYAVLTSRFEPTRRWEDACLIFSMIQAKRWKNQLFNYAWSQQRQPAIKDSPDGKRMPFEADFDLTDDMDWEEADERKAPCRVLQFKPLTQSPQEGDKDQP